MKEKFLLFPILAALFYLSGCSDDDNDLVNMSSVNMYGRNYDLAGGVIWENAPNKTPTKKPYKIVDKYIAADGTQVIDTVEGYTFGDEIQTTGNYMITLYEKGMSFNREMKRYEGEGACVSFHITSPDVQSLAFGKYVNKLGKEENTFQAYTSNDYSSIRAFSASATIKEGEMEFGKDGEDYSVNFDLTNTNGGKIFGNYKGKLESASLDRMNILTIRDIKLDGMLDSIHWEYYQDGVCIRTNKELDKRNGKSCYSTFNSQSRYPAFCVPEQIDIALKWNADEKYLFFETPMKMFTYLNHDKAFFFPCHTIYMNAPADFTEEDYINLKDADLEIEIKPEKVTIDEDTVNGRFIFFKTGNGLVGVMKIRRFVLPSRGTWEHKPSGQGNSWDLNPYITLDMKCQTVYADKRIG